MDILMENLPHLVPDEKKVEDWFDLGDGVLDGWMDGEGGGMFVLFVLFLFFLLMGLFWGWRVVLMLITEGIEIVCLWTLELNLIVSFTLLPPNFWL
jgi:hypothetical protein